MSKVPPGFSFSGTFSLRARTCAFFALFPLFTFPSIFVNPGTGCLPPYSIGPFKCERSPGQGGLVMGPGLYAPINSKVQHPPPGNPPGQPPGHLNFWRLPCSNSLPLGQESRSNAPTSPQKQISFSINTVHTFQREICRNDTFKLLLKTLLKELFSNKGEILSCKSVKPCKNRKNGRAYYVRTRDKSGSNSPPFQRNVQIPRPNSTSSLKSLRGHYREADYVGNKGIDSPQSAHCPLYSASVEWTPKSIMPNSGAAVVSVLPR